MSLYTLEGSQPPVDRPSGLEAAPSTNRPAPVLLASLLLATITGGPTLVAVASSVFGIGTNVSISALWVLLVGVSAASLLIACRGLAGERMRASPMAIALAVIFCSWYIVSLIASHPSLLFSASLYVVVPLTFGFAVVRWLGSVLADSLVSAILVSQTVLSAVLLPLAFGVGTVAQFTREVVPGISVHALGRTVSMVVVGSAILAATSGGRAIRSAAALMAVVGLAVAVRMGIRMAIIVSVVGLLVLFSERVFTSVQRRLGARKPTITAFAVILFAGTTLLVVALSTALLPADTGNQLRGSTVSDGFSIAENDVSISARTALANDARQTLSFQRPLDLAFGTGAGWYIAESVGDYPHNIVLEVAVELGIIGLALFVIFIASLLLQAMRTSHSRQALILVLVQLAYSLGSGSYQRTWEIWLWLGFLSGLVAYRSTLRPDHPRLA